MSSGRTPSKPDLFSLTSGREPASSSVASHTPPVAASSPRHVLPRDLPNAIKQAIQRFAARGATDVAGVAVRRRRDDVEHLLAKGAHELLC